MNHTVKGPLASHIARYIAHKRSLGKKLQKPEPLLYLLDRYLQTRAVTEIDQITPKHLDEFVASRQRRTPRSYNVLLCYLRGLFDWMVAHELLRTSPLLCEKQCIISTRRPFLFNPEQARRLLETARLLPSTPRAQSRGDIYRMIFALLYGLGLRVGEVSRLLRKDLDLDNQVLTILQTKFGKDRLVPFGPKMARALADFLQCEESRFGPIPVDGPHVWRHSTAVHLLESGVELNVIRDWLGHASLETTNRYAEITLRTKQAALENVVCRWLQMGGFRGNPPGRQMPVC